MQFMGKNSNIEATHGRQKSMDSQYSGGVMLMNDVTVDSINGDGLDMIVEDGAEAEAIEDNNKVPYVEPKDPIRLSYKDLELLKSTFFVNLDDIVQLPKRYADFELIESSDDESESPWQT